MAAYKDEDRGTWYVSFHYNDWQGKNKRKLKRGFRTKREALEWENQFKMKEASNLDMTFGNFYELYKRDIQPRLKKNTWLTKKTVINVKIMPFFKDKQINEIKLKDII